MGIDQNFCFISRFLFTNFIIDLQSNYSNYKLNTGPLKYRLILLPALFLICIINLFLIAVTPEILIMTNSLLSGNETISKKEHNLEFKSDNSTPASPGLKVEIVAISGPVSFESGVNHLSIVNHLTEIYSKKKCSLISHSNLIISKTLHLSPLITKLQI
jgi:hypothetical protein